MYSLFQNEDLYAFGKFLYYKYNNRTDLILHDCEIFCCDDEEKKELYNKCIQALEVYTDALSIFE